MTNFCVLVSGINRKLTVDTVERNQTGGNGVHIQHLLALVASLGWWKYRFAYYCNLLGL